MSEGENIKHFFQGRKELLQKMHCKAETLRKLWETQYPYASGIAGVYESLSTLLEELYELDEIFVKGLMARKEETKIVFDWIEYLKGEIDYLKSTIPAVPTKRENTERKIRTLEIRQRRWEKKYKPILEHLENWIKGEEERQKRLGQFKAVV